VNRLKINNSPSRNVQVESKISRRNTKSDVTKYICSIDSAIFEETIEADKLFQKQTVPIITNLFSR
jgi:hypothetical protein